MTGMTDIERLIALADIQDLKARRDHALDDKDWDTYIALHAPDHKSSHGARDGGDMGSAEDVVRQLSVTLDGVITNHHSHTPVIEFESPTRAKCVWAMEDNLFWKQGDEDHWLRGFGFYHETCEKRDGKWLFTSRSLRRTKVTLSPGALLGEERAAAKRS